MKEFEQIRQKIAEGDSLGALESLALRSQDDPATSDQLVLLHNRLAHLNQSVIEGTITREDENIERNTLNKALLNLLKALEQRSHNPPAETPLLTPVIAAEPPKTASTQQQPPARSFRPVLIIGASLLVLASIWGVGKWRDKDETGSRSLTLTARLVPAPGSPEIGTGSEAILSLGNFVSMAHPIPSNGVVQFADLPAARQDDSAHLTVMHPRFSYRIKRQSAVTPRGKGEIIFYTELISNTFQGKVLSPDLRPVPGVELDIENGLARAVSDADGNFNLTIPALRQETVLLVLRRQGKVLVSRKIGLNPEVLKELKVPD